MTAGGRVLVVTAAGDSLRMARDRAYEAVAESISEACKSAATSASGLSATDEA